MGTRSSPALLAFEAIRDLQSSWLTSCKTEAINITQSFLQMGQEDEGNEARSSEQRLLAFYWTSCQLQPWDPTGFECFAYAQCTYNTIWPCPSMLYLG